MEDPNQKFTLNPNVYEKLRFASQVLLPGISTLYFTIGTIWGLPALEKVVGTLAALALFLGGIVAVSRKNYNAGDAKYDGTVSVTPNEEGTALRLNIDPSDLIGKKELLLKLGPASIFDEEL